MQHIWNSRPGTTPDGRREVRRRHRATLSCQRCRRLKIKCDRTLPCSHCQRSKADVSCSYVKFASTKNPSIEEEGIQQQQRKKKKQNQGQVLQAASSSSLSSSAATAVSTPTRDMPTGDDRIFENQHAGIPPEMMFSETSVSDEAFEALVLDGASSGVGWPMEGRLEVPNISGWKGSSRGGTHWAASLKEFAAIPSESPRLARYYPIPQWEGNDEFATYGTPALLAEEQRPREFILSIIPDRETADRCVESYFGTVERIYRLLHVPSFRKEVRSFWDDDKDGCTGIAGNTTPWDWLAQLLMVIGLGYHSMTSTSSSEADADLKRVKRLYRGAETCLTRASFVLRPTILTVKTLCMMVIAKRSAAMSCEAYDSCSPLMGIAIRHAMAMGVHHDPSTTGLGFRGNGLSTPLEAAELNTSSGQEEMRKRLWTTIVQLEIQQSIASGIPPLLRAYDFDVPAPSNVNDDDFDPASSHGGSDEVCPRQRLEYTDSSFQNVLAKSLNPILEIVAAANNWRGIEAVTEYNKVLALDKQIRELLSELSAVRENLPFDQYYYYPDSQAQSWTTLQICTLEIFFRRALLILHWRPSQDPCARTQYPTSYWTSLECSLAILVHQRELYDISQVGQSTQWLAELFKNDFLLATMAVGIQLCRKDFSSVEDWDGGVVAPDGESEAMSPSPSSPSWSACRMGPAVMPRLTILDALKSCRDIWATNLRRSHCQSKAYEVIEEVIRSVEDGL